jgi:uncharacterized protein (DUF433 family)
MPNVQSLPETIDLRPTVSRTSRGLSIKGTRITLYSILDYLHAGWPPHLIRDEFNLTDRQISEVMEYVETHSDEVEREYQMVLQQAEESRQYWEARNKERLTKIAALPPKPGQAELRAKLQAAKDKLGMR